MSRQSLREYLASSDTLYKDLNEFDVKRAKKLEYNKNIDKKLNIDGKANLLVKFY